MPQLPDSSKTTPYRLNNRHFYLLRRHSGVRCIKNAATSRRKVNAISHDTLIGPKRFHYGMELYTADRGKTASRALDGKMHGVGDDVAELQQVKRAFVGHDGYVLADNEPGGKNLLSWR